MGESKWGVAAKRDFYRLSALRASAAEARDAVFPTSRTSATTSRPR